jgi:hypothetical protein
MTRLIKRTLARTSVVEWVPIRYPVIWAHDETEVTPWDPVCGGNPRAEYPKPEDDMKAGELWSSAHLLNGGGEPPPSRNTLVVSYPRLTRRTPYTPRNKPPKLGPKDRVCQDIAALTKYKGNEKRLKKEVLIVANKYGPLWPGINTSEKWDTLQAWKDASKIMRFYLDLVRLVKKHSTQIEGVTKEDRETIEHEERCQQFESVPREIGSLVSNFTNTGPFGNEKPVVDLPLPEYQQKLASHFWEFFTLFTHGNAAFGGSPGQLRVTCGSYAWAHKELWNLLTSRQHVLLCHRCNAAFIATRNDALTCSSACEKALQRQGDR